MTRTRVNKTTDTPDRFPTCHPQRPQGRSAATRSGYGSRALLAERRLLRDGDYEIGEALKWAGEDADGSWPPLHVRTVLEEEGSQDIERGLEHEVFSSRGATWRGITDGGGQERELAEKYTSLAKKAGAAFPRDSAHADPDSRPMGLRRSPGGRVSRASRGVLVLIRKGRDEQGLGAVALHILPSHARLRRHSHGPRGTR